MFMEDDDNKVMGIIGALIGSALGIGIWCLIGAFGKIAVVGGFALCLGAFGGYFLLGKGMSKTGLIITAVILLLSVYLAVRLDYAITLYRALEKSVSLGSCFSGVIKLLDAYGEKGTFYKDLALGYGMTLIGGVALFFKAAGGRK